MFCVGRNKAVDTWSARWKLRDSQFLSFGVEMAQVGRSQMEGLLGEGEK